MSLYLHRTCCFCPLASIPCRHWHACLESAHHHIRARGFWITKAAGGGGGVFKMIATSK